MKVGQIQHEFGHSGCAGPRVRRLASIVLCAVFVFASASFCAMYESAKESTPSTLPFLCLCAPSINPRRSKTVLHRDYAPARL